MQSGADGSAFTHFSCLEPPACPAWPGGPGDPQLVGQVWVSITLPQKPVGSCLFLSHTWCFGGLGRDASCDSSLREGPLARKRAPTRGPSARLGGDSWHLVPKCPHRWLNEIVVKEDAASEQVCRLGLDRLGCSRPFHDRLDQGGQRPEHVGRRRETAFSRSGSVGVAGGEAGDTRVSGPLQAEGPLVLQAVVVIGDLGLTEQPVASVALESGACRPVAVAMSCVLWHARCCAPRGLVAEEAPENTWGLQLPPPSRRHGRQRGHWGVGSACASVHMCGAWPCCPLAFGVGRPGLVGAPAGWGLCSIF